MRDEGGDIERDQDVKSVFDTKKAHMEGAMDFELLDYWDEGEVLAGRDIWPICITLNLVLTFSLVAEKCTDI
jgi:exosome complex component RRP42